MRTDPTRPARIAALVVLAFVLGLLLTACGGGTSDDDAPADQFVGPPKCAASGVCG